MEEKKASTALEMVESIVIAVVLALVIRFFIIEPFYIPSGSMEPTLEPGDRIIVSKVNYRFGEPQRGDVIVFRYPLDPDTDYIKRVVAVGGDRVEGRGGKLLVNGKVVPEPYLAAQGAFGDFGPVDVPEGHLFMMGDNRNNSKDSRFWGPLPRENVIGKALVIFWPVNRWGVVR